MCIRDSGPVELTFLGPLDVGVAQHRDEIVGERPVHRILEVEHARIVGAVEHHQVARVPVAVHEDARLREVVRQQPFEGIVQRRAGGVVEDEAAMALDVPLRIQVEFACEQRAIVFGKHVDAACCLHAHECFACIAHQCVDTRVASAAFLQSLQVGGRAEVLQQQEAAVEIGGEHLRHVHLRLSLIHI